MSLNRIADEFWKWGVTLGLLLLIGLFSAACVLWPIILIISGLVIFGFLVWLLKNALFDDF